MTEHMEVRIPVQELKFVLECKGCKTELVIDPKVKPERWSGDALRQTMQCSICDERFEPATVRAIQRFVIALTELGTHALGVAARTGRG